jgi:hypothetical protein
MLMPLFEKKYVDYLTVYKIPIGPGQLDPTVFYQSESDEQPKLLPTIHTQITKDLEEITSGQPYRIENYYLVGPCCNPGSKSRTGELRVIIQMNDKLKDVDVDGLHSEQLLKHAKNLSGRLAAGTGRKINYQLTVRPIKETSYEGIYDILRLSWFRTPNGLKTCSQP